MWWRIVDEGAAARRRWVEAEVMRLDLAIALYRRRSRQQLMALTAFRAAAELLQASQELGGSEFSGSDLLESETSAAPAAEARDGASRLLVDPLVLDDLELSVDEAFAAELGPMHVARDALRPYDDDDYAAARRDLAQGHHADQDRLHAQRARRERRHRQRQACRVVGGWVWRFGWLVGLGVFLGWWSLLMALALRLTTIS